MQKLFPNLIYQEVKFSACTYFWGGHRYLNQFYFILFVLHKIHRCAVSEEPIYAYLLSIFHKKLYVGNYYYCSWANRP